MIEFPTQCDTPEKKIKFLYRMSELLRCHHNDGCNCHDDRKDCLEKQKVVLSKLNEYRDMKSNYELGTKEAELETQERMDLKSAGIADTTFDNDIDLESI